MFYMLCELFLSVIWLLNTTVLHHFPCVTFLFTFFFLWHYHQHTSVACCIKKFLVESYQLHKSWTLFCCVCNAKSSSQLSIRRQLSFSKNPQYVPRFLSEYSTVYLYTSKLHVVNTDPHCHMTAEEDKWVDGKVAVQDGWGHDTQRQAFCDRF